MQKAVTSKQLTEDKYIFSLIYYIHLQNENESQIRLINTAKKKKAWREREKKSFNIKFLKARNRKINVLFYTFFFFSF